MKRIKGFILNGYVPIALVTMLFLFSNTNAQNLYVKKIDDAIGKTIYVTPELVTTKIERLAEVTLIEKKPGKYKNAKVEKDYADVYKGVRGLPHFFSGVYYEVIDEVMVDGKSYVRFKQKDGEDEIVFLIPKQKINEFATSGPILDLGKIEEEVNFIGSSYKYICYNAAIYVHKNSKYEGYSSERLKVFEENVGKCEVLIDGMCYGKFKVLGFKLNNKYKNPYVITAKFDDAELEFQYDFLQALVSNKALLTQSDLDNVVREAQIRDSLDNVRDHGVFLAYSKNDKDTVAVYKSVGEYYKLKHWGYRNGILCDYDKYSLTFFNSDDEDYLYKKKEIGADVRKLAAQNYSKEVVERRKIEKQKREEAERLETERRLKEIDSVLAVCNQKQIFIWKQDYAYGDYGRFGLEWKFYNCFKKDIKYIELIVKAYNQVDDLQRDDVGRNEARSKCIGPLVVGDIGTYVFNEMFWDDNDLINYLKLTYVKITFMDNTTKVYSGAENILKHRLGF